MFSGVNLVVICKQKVNNNIRSWIFLFYFFFILWFILPETSRCIAENRGDRKRLCRPDVRHVFFQRYPGFTCLCFRQRLARRVGGPTAFCWGLVHPQLRQPRQLRPASPFATQLVRSLVTSGGFFNYYYYLNNIEITFVRLWPTCELNVNHRQFRMRQNRAAQKRT